MEVATWGAVDATLESQLTQNVSLEGVVVREPDIRESTQHLYVDIGNELVLVTTDIYTEVSYGDRVVVMGTLQKPEPFETDLGRTFNYKGYLEARGVRYIVAFAHTSVIQSHQGNIVIEKLLTFKHAFMTKIESVIISPDVGLAEGLLLGVKQALGTELEDAFRKTGITHVVVLSGYNVMLVVTFVMYVLAFVLPLRGRLVFGVVAIVLFACLVGLSATVVRASAMAVLMLIAKATGRTYAVMRALVFTGIVMLVINPYLLAYDVGFQFSFVATLGLILVAPHLEKHLGFMPTYIGLREFLTATLSAQIFVMPILLYQMGQFSVVAIVVNLLVLPMVPLSMLLTFITGLVAFVSTTLAIPFAYLTYLSLEYILLVVRSFAALPFAAYTIPAFPFYVVIISYGILALLLWHVYFRKSTQKLVHKDMLTKWTIEDEEQVSKKLLEKSDTAAVPIYFR